MKFFEKLIYRSIYTLEDIPRPLKSGEDWAKTSLIQIDDQILDSAKIFLRRKLKAELILNEKKYNEFLEETKAVEKGYRVIRGNLLNLAYTFPRSQSQEIKDPDELKRLYINNCEEFRNSLHQLFSHSEDLFEKFLIDDSKNSFSDNKKIIDEGIECLTEKGLEGLINCQTGLLKSDLTTSKSTEL